MLWRNPMPWQLSNLMDERLKFVTRLLDSEQISSLCHEFGISRKTGYKIFNRHKDCGLEGLANRFQRPIRPGNQIPFQIERFILRTKKERSSWGAPKIREKLIRSYPNIMPPPKVPFMRFWIAMVWWNAVNPDDINPKAHHIQDIKRSNVLWCANCKGEFGLGNRQYCYPLTISNSHSRYLLTAS